ncbi:PEPxxWA-CTERM sorting domain-containing protein [Aquisediminimonas profunda]|uniref:PEPxxWA-CTERM sorting domain-containing protein n=1 Tax=Aquisediminimonas profunda TaxID=1550733 RepID=UPI001FE6C4E6|nr:PEPxxWA-CTERM sorting domain-containing protein [Aquisediminimonas profunda]
MKVRRRAAIKLVGISATIGLLAAFTVPSTNGGPSYGVAAARDILALLGDRSPGERKHGALTSTKVPKLPYEFAKAPIHTPVPENAPGEMGASPRLIPSLVEPETPFSVAPPPTPLSPDAPETPLPPVFTGSSGGTPIFVETGSSGGGSSGGGSSGGTSTSSGGTSTSSGGTSTSSGGTSTSSGGTSTSSGGTSTSSGGTSTSSGGTSSSSGGEPPPPIVPEPATWFMMLAGFGLVGTMLRRRKMILPVVDKTLACPPSGSDV